MAENETWPSLVKTYSFSTVADTSSYALPRDLSAIIPLTPYDDSVSDFIGGPETYESLALFEFQQGLLNYRLTPEGFNRVSIYPIPSETFTIKLKYKSKSWLLPKEWTAGESIVIGDYRSVASRIYVATSAGTTGATEPSHTTGTASDGGVSWSYYEEAYEMILKDTDFPVVSDLALEHGFIARVKEGLEQPNSLDLSRYQRNIKQSLGNAKGGKRLSLFGSCLSKRRNPRVVGF